MLQYLPNVLSVEKTETIRKEVGDGSFKQSFIAGLDPIHILT